MKAEPNSRFLRIISFLIISSLAFRTEMLISLTATQPLDTFSYEFIVNEDGFTIVNVTYTTYADFGSSWLLVPKFSKWINHTLTGKVTEWQLRETLELVGTSYHFYEALWFSFNSDGYEFKMNVQFNASTAAMVIEPDGIFYSPQIGFHKGQLKAKVILPEGFSINQDEAIAFGNAGSYRPNPTYSGPNYVLFDNIPETENFVRIEIGFRTLRRTPEWLTLQAGVFTFRTVPRYKESAGAILALFNKTYERLVDIFNVTLGNAEVRFFLPDFDSLFSVAGYVPFSSERIGEIYINIVFTRYVEGYVEVTALHELVHHFLWKTGISPQTILWFHEGMAEYISIEVANELGYEGARITKQELEDGIVQLKKMVGEDIGFIKQWSPSSQSPNTWPYYVGAYYVVSRLAETYGGVEYYARFFRLIKGKTIDSNDEITYSLGLAANRSVAETLNNWGFEVPDLYLYSPLLGRAEETLDEVNPIFQPYKLLAELLYRQALLNARQESTSEMQFYLAAAIFVAKLAPLLTLITISGILFGAVLLALSAKGVFLSR